MSIQKALVEDFGWFDDPVGADNPVTAADLACCVG
jgi:hypothetical protein